MVIALLAALAVSGCTVGTEDVPPLCPTGLPRIAAVTVERVGIRAYAEDERRVNCAAFRPTPAQVRGYLSSGRSVDPQAADATLDRSPCQAIGSVRFADGRVGRWRIEQLRVGIVQIGRRSLMLYCSRCRGPFND